MNEKIFFRIRLYFTGVVTILIWSLLLWDHSHGGVPSHHLLARKDMPSFSNWWGGLLIPLLTWFLLYRVHKRIRKTKDVDLTASAFPITILYGFVGALLFGVVLSIFFTLENEEVPSYMMMSLFATALFLPIYRAECFLGFVIGMTYTFGGVLPILIGSILTLLSALLYLFLRPAVWYIVSGLFNVVSTYKRKREG